MPARSRRTTTVVAALLSALVMALMITRLSAAGFSAATTNPSDNWATGTVVLTDDDAGAAMFATGPDGLLDGGQSLTRCIAVTYTGSVTTNVGVRTYATATGGLAPYLNLTVEEGSGGGAGTCSGFTPTETLYTGTLADYATTHGDHPSGVSAWAPTSTPQTRTYRFTATVQNVPSAQNQTASATFRWEAQAGLTATMQGLAAAVTADHPLAYWRLESATPGTGTRPATLLDSSGNGRDLTNDNVWVGAPGAAAIGGDSADFGWGTYATTAAAPAWFKDLTTYSAEAWVNTTKTSTMHVIAMDDVQQSPGNPARKFSLYLNNGQPVFMVLTTTGGYPYIMGSASIADGQWHHLVGTNDGTTMRLYVDGTLKASAPIGGTQVSGTWHLALGGTYYRYSGFMDEAAVYAGALTPERVAAHFQAGTTL